jgi:hypothetical protein
MFQSCARARAASANARFSAVWSPGTMLCLCVAIGVFEWQRSSTCWICAIAVSNARRRACASVADRDFVRIFGIVELLKLLIYLRQTERDRNTALYSICEGANWVRLAIIARPRPRCGPAIGTCTQFTLLQGMLDGSTEVNRGKSAIDGVEASHAVRRQVGQVPPHQ